MTAKEHKEGPPRNPLVLQFGESLSSKGKLPSTVFAYETDAQEFMDFLTLHSIPLDKSESSTLIAFCHQLLHDEGDRHNSVRRKLIAIRLFYRFLTDRRLISESPMDSVPIPARDESLPKALSLEDIQSLLEHSYDPKHLFKSNRDRAILALLAFDGLKTNELLSLEWPDFDLMSPINLRIRGLRGRLIQLSKETECIVRDYHQHYNASKNKDELEKNPKFLVSLKGRDDTPSPGLSRHGLKFVIYEIGQRAGFEALNSEQLRHHAMDLHLNQGRSPHEIMLHFGLRRLGNIAKHTTQKNKKEVLCTPA